MRKPVPKLVLSALSVTLLLAGCNSNDHDDPTTSTKKTTMPTMKTLVVTPSLGKIINARVVLRNAVTGLQLGERNTGTSGKVTFDVPVGVSTVITEVQGGNGAQYFDEATRQLAPMPSGATIRAATTLVHAKSEVGVTALTEVALQRAESLAGGGSIVPFLNQAKLATEQAFGVDNILAAPTLVDSAADMAALGVSASEQYALRLATLAEVAHKQLGAGELAPALKMAQALAVDFKDGDIDGSGTTGALPYDLASFAAEYQAQVLKLIQDFIASASEGGFDVNKLQALLTFIQNHPLTLNLNPDNPPLLVSVTGFAPASGAVGETVTISGDGFDDDLFHMVVKFANNVAAEIVSASPTQLVVKVPAGAVDGPITVINSLSKLSATSSASFTVQAGGGSDEWTARTLPTSFIVNSIAFGSGKFVVVGFGKGILTSTDGISWSVQNSANPNLPELKSIIRDQTEFVAVGGTAFGSSAPPLILTSPDGETWTTRLWTVSPALPETQLNDIASSGGRLTAVGANGTIITSTNGGETWSAEAQINNNTTFVSEFTGVVANGDVRVAVGRNSAFNGMIIRNDGSGWTPVASDMADFFPRDVVWTGSQFVAVGGDSANFGAGAVTMTSPDGVNWARHVIANAPVGHIFRSAFQDEGKLYAGGDNSQSSRMMMSSMDGINWTLEHQSTVAGQGAVAGIAGSPGIVVGVGGVKSITHSH